MLTSRARVSQLDLLRTFAVLLVFFWHFSQPTSISWVKSIGQYGWAGVELFFVLSGYLIADRLLKDVVIKKPISLGQFYTRRFLRIGPLYLFVLLLYFCFPGYIEAGRLPSLGKILTFTQNFGLDTRYTSAFSHAWSLCVEMQFYLLMPLIIIILARFGRFNRAVALFVGIIVCGALLRSSLWNEYIKTLYHPLLSSYLPPQLSSHLPSQLLKSAYHKEIFYPTYCRLDSLTVGVGIASLRCLRPALWKEISRQGNFLLAFGAYLLAVACWLFKDMYSWQASTFAFPVVAFGFGAILIAALSPYSVLKKVEVPGASAIATLSFSFYLTHKQIIALIKGWVLSFKIHPNAGWFVGCVFIACLMVSTVLYILLERRFLAMRDSLTED